MREKIEERKTAHYLILLSIAHNPHSEDPSRLIEILGGRVSGTQKAQIKEIPYIEQTEIDKTGFERLKMAMADNPRIAVK